MLSVRAPACIVDALSGCRKLLAVRSVKVAYEEVAHASVVRNRCVAYSVKNVSAVRRYLRVRESSEGKKYFRSHMSLLDLDFASGYVAFAADCVIFCHGA